jgi:translation initiation factor eIF-2B subunit beta
MNGIAELAVGNIVKRVLHVIREEDFSVATNALRGLASSAGGDNRDTAEHKDFRAQNVAAVAAGPPSRPPSLHSLLDRTPDSAIAHHSSYIGDSFEGKGKCKLLYA